MATDPLRTAVSLHQSGRLAEASQLYEQILRAKPMHAGALALSGLLALDQGDAAKAAQRLKLAATIEPRNPSHAFSLGEALRAQGRDAEALSAYRTAARLDGRNALFQVGLGVALKAAGETDEAFSAFRHAASLDPRSVPALANLGAMQLDRDEVEAAAETLRKACTAGPDHAEALYNLGTALYRLGRFEEAVPVFDRALAADAGHWGALNNLGMTLTAMDQNAAALDCFERALALRADHPQALYNRGNVLKNLGRLAEAVASYDAAVAVEPANGEVRMNRGLVRLTLGDFAGGWQDYLHRKLPRSAAEHPAEPLPADLAGRRFFLRREQGLGDELFFLRFAPALVARGAAVTVEADPRIAAMVARSGTLTEVVPTGTAPADGREPLWLADLPFLTGHAAARPAPPPLPLTPLPERVAAMRARLAELGPAPWLGITWRAGGQRAGRFAKSIDLERLGPAVAAAPGTLVALQRLPAPGEIETLAAAAGRPVHDLTALNDDLEDMLALLACLDDYVAVSNANIHLRAGLSQRCRILVPFPPEYRWLAAGDAVPWYPGFTVHREDGPGGWGPALDRLAGDLGGGPAGAMRF